MVSKVLIWMTWGMEAEDEGEAGEGVEDPVLDTVQQQDRVRQPLHPPRFLQHHHQPHIHLRKFILSHYLNYCEASRQCYGSGLDPDYIKSADPYPDQD
jgi:hypothetical protein